MQREAHVKKAPLTITEVGASTAGISQVWQRKGHYFRETAFLSVLGQLTKQAGSCKACCFFDSFPGAQRTVDALLTNALEKFFVPGNTELLDNLKVDTFSLYLCININRISTATPVPGDLPILLFPWLTSRQVGEKQAIV